MKNSVLLLALAGLGLTASPSHAFVQNLVTVGPNFSTTLTNFADTSTALITGSGPNGTFNLGRLYFDGQNGQLDIVNDTAISVDPASSNYFTDPTFNVSSDVTFVNVLLTETFAGAGPVSVPLVSLYDSTTPTTTLDSGLYELLAPSVPAGSILVSATVTGQFSDGTSPIGQNQQMYVVAVPETNTTALLLVGLALAALPVLSARIRAGRRTQ